MTNLKLLFPKMLPTEYIETVYIDCGTDIVLAMNDISFSDNFADKLASEAQINI